MHRDDKIDGVKAVLIFLMVLGHMVYSDYRIKTGQMIYAFHMPAFVFISGYLTSLSPNFKKHVRWVWATLAIYIGAQWYQNLYGMILQLLHEDFELTRWNILVTRWKLLVGLCPCFSLWYILSLVYWRIGLWLVYGHISDRLMLIVSIFAAIASGFFPVGNQLSFQRTLVFMPMFVIGYLFKKHNLSLSISRMPVSVCVVFLLFGLFASRYIPFFMPSSPYSRLIHDAIIRSIQCILAFVLTISLFRVLYAIPVNMISRWGKHTLWIYIGHSVPITLQNVIMRKYYPSFNVLEALIVSALYVAGFTFIAECFHNIRSKRLALRNVTKLLCA